MQQFGCPAARNVHAVLLDPNRARQHVSAAAHFFRHRFAPNLTGLAAQHCVGPGPRCEPAHAVVNFRRRCATSRSGRLPFSSLARRWRRAESCVRGLSVPASMPRSVSTMSGAPDSDMRAANSGVVSVTPIGISCCSSISPVSMPASMRIVVTPLFVSPFTMAQLIGAAPRYFGSREAWRLIQPSRGIGRSRAGIIWPYAMITMQSGAMASRVCLGFRCANFFRLMHWHAGGERSFLHRRKPSTSCRDRSGGPAA